MTFDGLSFEAMVIVQHRFTQNISTTNTLTLAPSVERMSQVSPSWKYETPRVYIQAIRGTCDVQERPCRSEV